ncbi:MAG: DUF421 domain-containing protein [Oscillospiraceae bacterium]|nr:DUF421 domain-containing protein [Oscillospiraceae bacterium]
MLLLTFLNDIYGVILASAASLAVLFILSKLMGNKQISQLTMFDYIIGITIGSIAAELATDLKEPLQPITAMLFYGLAAYLVTLLSLKSVKARKFIIGRPLILLDNGKIYRKNLRKSHLDISDFMMLCRSAGYFDLSKVQTAVIETNGSLSILPVTADSPATPTDLKIETKQEHLQTAVILDGYINAQNLKLTGNNDVWLQKQLKEQGYNHHKEILLALCTENNELTLFPLKTKNNPSDVFE